MKRAEAEGRVLRPANDNSGRDAPASEISAFKLSRVFAQGWNAARKLSAEKRDKLTPQAVAALNPHANEPERARWAAGFTKALGRD